MAWGWRMRLRTVTLRAEDTVGKQVHDTNLVATMLAHGSTIWSR